MNSVARRISIIGVFDKELVTILVVLILGLFSECLPGQARPSSLAAPSLAEIVSMGEEELATLPIEILSLRCAEGLPGAENLEIPAHLSTLDRWTELVRQETDKYFWKFQQKPEAFKNSEGYYRMLAMVTVLMRDLGNGYNLDLDKEDIPDQVFYADARDITLHGLLQRQMGTCASMPVLYVAIGRRLGYPVFLIRAKQHLFVRWQDKNESFNVEATNSGMNTYPDEYYHTWPKPLSSGELVSGEYLSPLRPRQELSAFLMLRRLCFAANKRYSEAEDTYILSQKVTKIRRN